MKFAMFWGCTIPWKLPFIETAARKVLPMVDIEFVDLPFSCCPDPTGIQSLDLTTWYALAARNICIAEKKELDILTICNGCFETLKSANKKLTEDSRFKSKINKILKETGREFKGKIQVRHIQDVLYNDLGPEKLREQVINPIDLKVATHVGCHYTRPEEVMQTDDPNYPVQLDELVEVLGTTSVPYLNRNLCCGAGAKGVDFQVALSVSKEKLLSVQKSDAQAMVVHCPTCFYSYDTQQLLVKRKVKGLKVPVLHYLELLGIALGLNPSELALNQHRVKVDLFKKKEIVTEAVVG